MSDDFDFLRLHGEDYCLLSNNGYRVADIQAGNGDSYIVTFNADGRTDVHFFCCFKNRESVETLKECVGMDIVEFFVKVWKLNR
jgi:hypothetical protein